MRKLETFNGENRHTYYMPDDTCVNITDKGIAFFNGLEHPETILWLPKEWGYVWNDKLAT